MQDTEEKSRGKPSESGGAEAAGTAAVRLKPCFPWENSAGRAFWAFLLFSFLLYQPPREGGRYGPKLPLPPLKLWAARVYVSLGIGALLLRLLAGDELEIDGEAGGVRRVRRLLAVREPVDSWGREELAATSVRATRRRYSYGGRRSGMSVGTPSFQGATTEYQPVIVTARQELLPISDPLSEDLVGANTLAEETAGRLGIEFVSGRTNETVRLRPAGNELEIAMEPAILHEDYAPTVPLEVWLAGGGWVLVELVVLLT